MLHDAIVDCYIDKQRPIDCVDWASHLVTHGKLEISGGPEYVASFLERVPTPEKFIRLLKQYSK